MTARGGDFKASLRAGETHFGLFLCLPTFPTAEALAQSDFGFYIIDVEHGPTSVPNVHVQLTALAGSSAATIARLSANDPVAIKYYLDIGTDALMIPNVESAAMARDAARYMRYAPDGVRGVGGSMRVTDYGRNMAYFKTANEQACFVAQIESVATVPEHRERGHARAVVTRALELTADRRLVFLGMDPNDWPRHLYARLGMDDIGRVARFRKAHPGSA